MEQVRSGERRTRDLSWGDARARALMHALAGDAAARTGFRVCAIEVVRPKGLLEFVAIHGDPTSAEERLGTASRLADMQLVFAQGEEHGHFLWIPNEFLTEEIRERIDGVIVVPEVATTGEQGDWHPMDMLVARIADERGDLRALLYLDVPHELARPDDARLMEISDELATILRSILTVVEREEYADHMRVIRATRRLARSNPARHDVNHLLREARSTLLGALYVDELEIRVFLDQDVEPPPTAWAWSWRPRCGVPSTRPPRGRGPTSGCSSSSPGTSGATPSSRRPRRLVHRRDRQGRLRGRRHRPGRGRRPGARHADVRAAHRLPTLDRR